MHMTSAPHLLTEDRPDFERILDQALRTAENRPDRDTAGQRLSTQQLRTMALSAATAISACAAVEYERYVQARDALRTTSSSTRPTGDAGPADRGTVSLTSAMGDVAGGSGAGLVAALAVLAPVLAGVAAVIFLVVGYALRVFAPDAAMGAPLVTAGWIFAACAAVGILIAAVALLTTALRNGGAGRGRRSGAGATEVEKAREAWHLALLERGVVPFLQQALADPGHAPATPDPKPPTDHRPPRSGAAGRTPHLGYSRPGFTSPGDPGSQAASRPRYSSPDFTSPDLGGRDHRSS